MTDFDRAETVRLRGLPKILTGPLDMNREAVLVRVEAYRLDPQCFLSREQIEQDLKAVADLDA